jgi:hypothetical protein
MDPRFMVLDERTEVKFSSFHEKKDGIVEPKCEKLTSGRRLEFL